MPEQTDSCRTGADSELLRAFKAAEALEPNDRLRLIMRLWASLPADHWAAPTPYELHEFERRLREYDQGRLVDAPWDFVQAIVKNRSRPRPAVASKLYFAPRRFDLFTIMLVTAAYAILLSGMSALGFAPVFMCYVAIFITVVAAGQALLSGLSMPRAVSVYTGMVAYFVGTLSYTFIEPRFDLSEAIPAAIVFSLLFGSISGYLAGVLVGGVFLVADLLRQRYGRNDDNEPSTALASDSEPHAPAHPLDDVATLSR